MTENRRRLVNGSSDEESISIPERIPDDIWNSWSVDKRKEFLSARRVIKKLLSSDDATVTKKQKRRTWEERDTDS